MLYFEHFLILFSCSFLPKILGEEREGVMRLHEYLISLSLIPFLYVLSTTGETPQINKTPTTFADQATTRNLL
jgi:hypothetical protein